MLALQILAALVMIGLVLIQHGKGADMGASFGSGASGSLFGATGSANFLSRSTAVLRGGLLRLHAAAGVLRPCTAGRRRQRARRAAISAPPAAPAPAPPSDRRAQIPAGSALVDASAARRTGDDARRTGAGRCQIPAK